MRFGWLYTSSPTLGPFDWKNVQGKGPLVLKTAGWAGGGSLPTPLRMRFLGCCAFSYEKGGQDWRQGAAPGPHRQSTSSALSDPKFHIKTV